MAGSNPAAIRRGIVDALEFSGYQVIESADGVDGLGKATQANYDLLLLAWPVLAAAGAFTTGKRTLLDGALLGLLLLLLFNPFTSSFVIDRLPMSDELGALTALTLIGTFVVSGLLLRREQAAPAG